jgi:hypothetical protein
MPLTEDQHAVGEFGSDGADEPLGETVRSRAVGRNPDYLDARIGQDGIKRRGELAGSISDEEPELGDAVAEIHDEVADLLGSPAAVWVGGRAQQVHRPVADLVLSQTTDSLLFFLFFALFFFALLFLRLPRVVICAAGACWIASVRSSTGSPTWSSDSPPP